MDNDRFYLTDEEREELAELTAEVIASKTARADWKHHLQYGPGMITDIELSMEHIFEIE